MHPITLRVPEELDESLTEEAESEGFASRAAYVRYLLQRHPERTGTDTESNTRTGMNTGANTSRMRSDIESNTNRLDQLEERLDDLESKSHTLTTTATHTEGGSGDAENTDTNLQDVRDRVRSQLSEDRTPHVREATIDVVALLASEGELATKELQNRLYEDYADDYSSARTFWNSISRYVEQVDGIEHPYGSWKYAPE